MFFQVGLIPQVFQKVFGHLRFIKHSVSMKKHRILSLSILLMVGCDSEMPLQQDNVSPKDPEAAAKEVLDTIMSTPQGRAEVERIGGKDNALTDFQKVNGISEPIVEAAIKEWVLTHKNNFDWDLEEVKAICLRNMSSGIPYQYRPESEK